MIAKFIGKTSCGFVNGNIDVIHFSPRKEITVFDRDSSALCPYSNSDMLLKNWEVIKFDPGLAT